MNNSSDRALCPSCRRLIPDNQLGCPSCTAAKSYQGILHSQRPIVRRIEKGEMNVTLVKQAGHPWHIMLASYPQAWCGATLNTRWKKTRTSFSHTTSEICDRCREVLEQLAQDETSSEVA